MKERHRDTLDDKIQEQEALRATRKQGTIEQIEQAVREQSREDEQEGSYKFSLRRILGGGYMTSALIRRHWKIILLVLFFVLWNITNRYRCERQMIEIDRLTKNLDSIKFRTLSVSSQLTEKSRESNVLNLLKHSKDSNLTIATEPPYIIEVKE